MAALPRSWNPAHSSKRTEEYEFVLRLRREKATVFFSLRAQNLRNEGAADTEAALRGPLKPYWLEAYADRRKNGDMQDGQDVFRKIFLGVELDGDAPETEVDNSGASRALFAERGISVGARHRNALGLALNCVHAGRRRLGRSGRFLRSGGRSFRFGLGALRGTSRFNGNRRRWRCRALWS